MKPSDFLIEPAELATQLKAGTLVIDARPAGAFAAGHIPGAVPFSSYDELVTDTALEGMASFIARMAERFSAVGATSERPIVVYEDDTGMRAAREQWLLEYAGHRNVRMLHGGLDRWKAEGGPIDVDTDVVTVRPRKFSVSISSGSFVSAAEICRRMNHENFAIVDVRDHLEWAGKDDTPCCVRRGHIPRAKHIEWTQFLEDGRFKPADAILELLAKHGINPNGEIVTYCHRGARSANTHYALRYAGVTSARNYIGSWHEWSARADLPVEC